MYRNTFDERSVWFRVPGYILARPKPGYRELSRFLTVNLRTVCLCLKINKKQHSIKKKVLCIDER
jgi:hypothetical protein